MPRKPLITLAALSLLAVVACSPAVAASSAPAQETTSLAVTTEASSASEGSASLDAMISANQESHFQADDATVDESAVVDIQLSGSTASATGDGVSVDGSTVTITSSGVFRLSGSLEGQVVVDADAEDVQLIFDNVTLSSATGSPLVVLAADEVTIVLAEGSSNTVTDASTYADTADDAPNAAISSAADISIAGTGKLTVTGNHNDAINSSDGVVITGGEIVIEAVDDGIRGKDYVIVNDGALTVAAGGDALKSDNEEDADRGFVLISGGAISVTAGDDAIKGFNDVGVAGGTIAIESSVEGIEAQAIAIAGGVVSITSSDDGINVSGDNPQSVDIAGGTVTIDAGGDGFDSNGAATLSGGTLIVHGPTNDGNGSIDVDQGFDVTGGVLWAVGSSGMAQTPSEASTQNFVAATLDGTATGTIVIADGTGEVASIETTKQVSSIVYSAPEITSDGTYEIVLNGESAGTFAANQFIQGMRGGPVGGRRP